MVARHLMVSGYLVDTGVQDSVEFKTLWLEAKSTRVASTDRAVL